MIRFRRFLLTFNYQIFAIPGLPASLLLAYWGGISAMSAIFAALCLSSQPISPPHPLWMFLLQTKGEPQFDRPMTERSKVKFSLFWSLILLKANS
jgi:hypothetical protein